MSRTEEVIMTTISLRNFLVTEFEHYTRRIDSVSKSFICHYDLKKIWSDIERIRSVLYVSNPPERILLDIQKRMYILLSILVAISAEKCLEDFTTRFFDNGTGEPRITDNDLPLDYDDIKFFPDDKSYRSLFYREQYMFKPYVIKLKKFQEIIKIGEDYRLPFEKLEEKIASGTSGTVDRAWISPEYLIQADGSHYGHVAIKRITKPKNLDGENKMNQILRESITNQDHILMHLVTIKHGSERFILFPYAELGTLHEFLHCGRDISDDKKYNYAFNERFNVRDNDLAAHMLRQCEAVAGALKWLHSGITLEEFTEEKVFCAHLDLKPDNILICEDKEKRSIVGKWVISDFNISVIERRGPKQDGVVIETIRDYYRQATMDMRPQRRKGTYQAPEVEQAEKEPTLRIGRRSDVWSFGCIFSEVLAFALNRDKEVIRFNDAFRKRARGNNYFYDPKQLDAGYQVRSGVIEWLDDIAKNSKTDQSLGKCWVATIKEILVVELDKNIKPHRPDSGKLEELVKHVRLHEYHSGEREKIRCPYLQPEGVPVAKAPIERSETQSSPADLLTTEHRLKSLESRSSVPSQSECVNDRQVIENQPLPKIPAPSSRVATNFSKTKAPSAHEHEQTSPITDTPKIFRSDTSHMDPINFHFEEHIGRGAYNQDGGASSEDETKLQHERPEAVTQTLDTNNTQQFRNRGDSLTVHISRNDPNGNAPICEQWTVNTKRSSSPIPPSHAATLAQTRDIVIDEKSNQPGQLSEDFQPPDPRHRDSNLSMRAPPNAEGIFIGHHLPLGRAACISKVIETQNVKSFAVALSASENCIRAAFLRSNGVQVVNVDLDRQKARIDRDYSFSHLKPFDQKSSPGIAFAGPFLAIWGYSGTKVLYIQNVDQFGTLQRSGLRGLDLLHWVAMSKDGVVALICDNEIIVASAHKRFSEVVLRIPVPDKGQSFIHAAFNDAGNIFYAWAMGNRLESLYIWRVYVKDNDLIMNDRHKFETHYASEGMQGTRLIPYNAYMGCIIAAPRKWFFTANIHPSLYKQDKEPQPDERNDVQLSKVETACIFSDHSMITIEKRHERNEKGNHSITGFFKKRETYLNEYHVEPRSPHVLKHNDAMFLTNLSSNVEASSQMRVIKNNEIPVAVVCNVDGTIEILQFPAANPPSIKSLNVQNEGKKKNRRSKFI